MPHLTPEELDEEQRLIEAAQRDISRFGPLYERYVDQIFAYCYTLTRNRTVAEEVTSATFAKAMEEIPRFEWRGVPYSAWLYRVAAREVSRTRRRPEAGELTDQHRADTPDPADVAVRLSRDAEIRAAVSELPRDQRDAIMLHFGGGLKNKEIGDIMGRSEGAVKLLTFRGLTALRHQLGAPLPSERTHDKENNR
jgi:RNA polymerase sigma-70 factor (ECF subfamily)